jgi:hypothetical protein
VAHPCASPFGQPAVVQIGYPADLSASAVNLAIAYKDVGMPLLSGTDNGQWLDPVGLFSLNFIGLEGSLVSF